MHIFIAPMQSETGSKSLTNQQPSSTREQRYSLHYCIEVQNQLENLLNYTPEKLLAKAVAHTNSTSAINMIRLIFTSGAYKERQIYYTKASHKIKPNGSGRNRGSQLQDEIAIWLLKS